jgi:hypothetical protein
MITEGQPIDLLDELDALALGRPHKLKRLSTDIGPHNPGRPQAGIDDIRAALAAIPNNWVDWEQWNTLGMAVYAASGASADGFDAFDAWSAHSEEYDAVETASRWRHFTTSPPTRIGFGSLLFWGRRQNPALELPTEAALRRKREAEQEEFERLLPPDFPDPPPDRDRPVSFDDFYAYMPTHQYIFIPNRELWPGASVNARLPAVKIGEDKDRKPTMIAANAWLDRNRPVEQMTWAPGLAALIRHRQIIEGGWIGWSGLSCFNLYRAPRCR